MSERRLFSGAFVAATCAQMAGNYCTSTFLLLPKYLSTQLSASASDIGRVTAVQGISAVLAVPFVGGLLDRWGRRPLMAAGALLSLAYALCWIGISHIGPAVYALQMLNGVAFILSFSGSSTLITDLSPPARLGQAIGVFGAANISMNALAPAIAEPAAAHFGWPAAFGLAAASSGLSLLLTRFVSEPVRSAHTADADSGGDLAQTLVVMRRLSPYLIAMATCGASLGAVFTYYQPWALEQGATHVSLFFVGFTLAAVTTRIGLGSIADRIGRRRVALRAYVLYAFVVLAMTQLTPGRLLGLGIACGFAHGFFYPALNALALEYTSAHERGRAMTLVNGAFHLGNTLSVYVFGWVAHSVGYVAVFVSASFVTCCGLAVLLAEASRHATEEASAAE